MCFIMLLLCISLMAYCSEHQYVLLCCPVLQSTLRITTANNLRSYTVMPYAHNVQTGIALQWELASPPPVQRSAQRSRNGFLSSNSSHLPTAVPTNSNNNNNNRSTSSSSSTGSSSAQQFDQSYYAPLQLPHSYRVAEALQAPPPLFAGTLHSTAVTAAAEAAPAAAAAAAATVTGVQRLTTEGIVHFAACCRDIGRRGTAAGRRCSGALLV
jgi:hypothetical protein